MTDNKPHILRDAKEFREHRPKWAVDQVVRASGLIEDTCEHGVGHPNTAWLVKYDPDGKRCLSVHGCDGCCMPITKAEIKCI